MKTKPLPRYPDPLNVFPATEQQEVFKDALRHGLVRNPKEAFELGAANLRPRIAEQKQADKDAAEAAALAEAEALALREPKLF